MFLFTPPFKNKENNNILLSLLLLFYIILLCLPSAKKFPDDFLHQQFSIPLLLFLLNTPQSDFFPPNSSLKFFSLGSPATSVLINQLLGSQYSSQQQHMAQLTTPFSLSLTPLASRISYNVGILLHSSRLLSLLASCLPFCPISKGWSGPRLPPCTYCVHVHSPGSLIQPHGLYHLYIDDSQFRPPSQTSNSQEPEETQHSPNLIPDFSSSKRILAISSFSQQQLCPSKSSGQNF